MLLWSFSVLGQEQSDYNPTKNINFIVELGCPATVLLIITSPRLGRLSTRLKFYDCYMISSVLSMSCTKYLTFTSPSVLFLIFILLWSRELEFEGWYLSLVLEHSQPLSLQTLILPCSDSSFWLSNDMVRWPFYVSYNLFFFYFLSFFYLSFNMSIFHWPLPSIY